MFIHSIFCLGDQCDCFERNEMERRLAAEGIKKEIEEISKKLKDNDGKYFIFK